MEAIPNGHEFNPEDFSRSGDIEFVGVGLALPCLRRLGIDVPRDSPGTATRDNSTIRVGHMRPSVLWTPHSPACAACPNYLKYSRLCRGMDFAVAFGTASMQADGKRRHEL